MRKVEILTVTRVGDEVRVEGTVDGRPVEVQAWWSHLTTLGDTMSQRQYLVRRLLDACPEKFTHPELCGSYRVHPDHVEEEKRA